MSEQATHNDGFVFFKTYYEAMQYLPDSDRLALYDAICQYGIYGVEPENLPPIARGFFILQRPNIDASLKRFKTNQENGRKGGAPKGNRNASKQPKNNPNSTDNQAKINLDKDKDKDKDIDKDMDKDMDKDICVEGEKTKRPKRFSPPTVSQVQDYVQEKGYGIDAQRFVDFYASKGWRVGNTPMKDWQAAVRNWASRNGGKAGGNDHGSMGEGAAKNPAYILPFEYEC